MLLFNVLLVGRYVWQHQLYAQPTKVFATVGETAIDPGCSHSIGIQWFHDHSIFFCESQWYGGPIVSIIGGTHYIPDVP